MSAPAPGDVAVYRRRIYRVSRALSSQIELESCSGRTSTKVLDTDRFTRTADGWSVR